ncbi:hypothetical protein ACFWDB_03345 [Micromonospora chalcea]|uniref:hypothetical protein n=2 Tax=Micromonospora TaxID=1873 RepID=UPI00093BE303|nr:hypothetical protein [Micromonospora sp. TSRI0369]
MTSFKYLVSGEQRFVAVVLAGEDAAATRLWVCLAPEGVTAGSGWVGCWSSSSGQVETAHSLGWLLEALNAGVARVGRVGPFGAFLDDHLFFDGWDAWGSGIPAPIAGLAPVDVMARAESCRSSEDLVGKLFGREV